MSGTGILPNAPDAFSGVALDAPPIARTGRKLVSAVVVAFALEARAQAIEAALSPDRVQPHSRQLPTEAEQQAAAFAARQLRVVVDDLRGGLIVSDGEEVSDDEG